MKPVEFKKFPSIPRGGHGFIITEKIDGTNAQIYISNDGSILAGSRNRWLTTTSDNYGFCEWVEANKEALLTLGPGRHFGEWWGCGVQRGYNQTQKRFSLFNAQRWNYEREENPSRPCWSVCDIVPILYHGPCSSGIIEKELNRLKETGSIAAPGFMNPEGIVTMHVPSGYQTKLTYDNRHKGK